MTKPLMGQFEIAERLGISRQRVQQLVARADWPKPYVTLAMGKVWHTKDIEAWISRHRPNDTGPEEDERDTPPGRRHGRTKHDT
ncbi:DNA-binding protein [Micromonospora sp. NPDC049891]|uniref:helix-turn-helix transcriptional regulator n=1 Tax=Micromonospora sp. NPDC049891 TaxID=3155655 RepID=UPI0033D9917E